MVFTVSDLPSVSFVSYICSVSSVSQAEQENIDEDAIMDEIDADEVRIEKSWRGFLGTNWLNGICCLHEILLLQNREFVKFGVEAFSCTHSNSVVNATSILIEMNRNLHNSIYMAPCNDVSLSVEPHLHAHRIT